MNPHPRPSPLLLTATGLLALFAFPQSPVAARQPVPVQRIPDPAAGERYLLYGDYIGAGIPLSLWKKLTPPQPASARQLPRPETDPSVADDLNQYITPRNAEVVSGVNCFACHSSRLRGQLIIGLGNSLRDWPQTSQSYHPLRLLGELAFSKDSPERETLTQFIRGAEALEGTAPVPIRGLNPAFRFEEVAAAHRNPADLSWSDRPLYDIPPDGAWSDVPAWWNVRKKQTLYYNGMGHGDFARLIQQIGVVMINDSTDTQRTLPHMQDALAYIKTLKPPPFPGTINPTLREAGQAIFVANCTKCHGTYGENESYPNKIIPVDKVGTDPVYADRFMTSGLTKWFNQSWFAADGGSYNEITRGYIAPPLDGVWCTAPYFHNGSVPTLEGVLSSHSRPLRWQRSFRDDDYDLDAPGWRFHPYGEEFVGPLNRETYDTSIRGCGNGGHTFGDDLTDEERNALIQYLKSL